MALAANKRSIMTLFSGADDLYSHQVRIVLAEKGVTVDVLQVDPNDMPEDLLELNPYNSVPTLVDRELVLYESRIIMEYLDERFPHPPLMPVYPVSRGQSRLMMHRIDTDWYTLVDRIKKGDRADAARKELREGLIAISALFGEMPYFMNEEFGLADCYLGPLLWRLPALGIHLDTGVAKDIKAYMTRIFERESFKASLTEAEREMRMGM
ncbi:MULTISPECIES: stringent starvation protein SspA [Shewanella]|jgi:RNA polymerase-associated protein|uniref:Stringent starvation protein A n=2 Tax=Shewanella TaxID=22 RepID=A0AAJ1BGY1_9GAMM|nr:MULTISPECIES: stringent starvation protein SspA [Shewanella]AZQ11999.1 Stringent starvation protein A [Shewanella khirikhana]MCH4294563.1 stringent starvation protein A [Shewanella zhuhaiensis]